MHGNNLTDWVSGRFVEIVRLRKERTKMKIPMMFFVAGICLALRAETVVIRQPGLVESVGQAAVGTVQCVGEMAKGLVIGNSTVIQSNGAVNTVIAAPAATVLQSPVVVSPAVPLMPYGAYYGGYYGYRHYYGGYGRYWRSYRHGRYGCRVSQDLCNAAAITGIVANSLQAVSAVTAPVAVANPVAPVVVAQPPAVAVPQPVVVSAPAPCVVPAVVAPYGRAGRVVYYGF